MELWIRSQDGERLTKCLDLRIYYAKLEDVWVIEDCDDLGYYKTKERTLQVLDEIQNAMLLNGLANEETKTTNLEIRSWFATNSKTCLGVYQMPKE